MGGEGERMMWKRTRTRKGGGQGGYYEEVRGRNATEQQEYVQQYLVHRHYGR